MSTREVGRLLLILIFSLGLTACGAVNLASAPVSTPQPAPAQTPPTTLDGNWLLAGSRSPAAYPVVSAFLHVDGNTVTGQAAFFAQCTNAAFTASNGSGDFPINGTIASDGSFQATSGALGDATLGTASLSLTGNSPLPASPSAWTATYSLVFTPGSTSTFSCNSSHTAAFTATPIAPLTGTYIGVPVSPLLLPGPFGSAAAISVQITQGTPTLVTQGSATRYRIPLTASLTIDNSPCPLSDSTTGSPGNSFLSGDSFSLALISGPPTGVLLGTLNDTTANAFQADLTSLAQANGCQGIALYNFTRK